jgi:5'-nucleotidase
MFDALPLALVTNDDGIDSPFLHALVRALLPHFAVRVAAPELEQSWIGRALSRHREVSVRPTEVEGAPGWAIGGTPTDCVNLCLGHLLGEVPAIVVAGINIGYNTTMPMMLSSGTLAGAIEGAHWRLPAMAASQTLAREDFLLLQKDRSRLPGRLAAIVEASAAHAAQAAREIAAEAPDDVVVHNLNYPATMHPAAGVRRTVAAEMTGRCFFEPAGANRYRFAYRLGETRPSTAPTDRDTLAEGLVSWTRLNFSSLARSIE